MHVQTLLFGTKKEKMELSQVLISMNGSGVKSRSELEKMRWIEIQRYTLLKFIPIDEKMVCKRKLCGHVS